MRFRIKETRHTRNISVDIDIKNSDEEFVGLLDENNSPKQIKPIIEDAWKGLKSGNPPELSEDGVGGTYFIYNDAGSKIAVFKPQDEEPHNVNNPKGYHPRRNSDAGIKEGILVGEASLRECAAYLLDHNHFAAVPVTDLVLCQHSAFHSTCVNNSPSCMEAASSLDYSEIFKSPKLSPSSKVKIGSFQQFIKHDGDCEDIGRSMIATFPVDEVHKIAQLDIRIMNADRHGGNILYRKTKNHQGKETYELIPIDHGYALPSTLDEAWFEWLNWPQAKEKMSSVTLNYIAQLDPDLEAAMLKEKFGNTIRDEHLRVLKIATLLLKKGAVAGLTLFQLGSMVCRPNLNMPSALEDMCARASELAPKTSPHASDHAFFYHLCNIMDTEIQKTINKTGDDEEAMIF